MVAFEGTNWPTVRLARGGGECPFQERERESIMVAVHAIEDAVPGKKGATCNARHIWI